MARDGRVCILLDNKYTDILQVISYKTGQKQMVRAVEEALLFYVEKHPTLKAEIEKRQADKEKILEETRKSLETTEVDIKTLRKTLKHNFEFLDITG